MAISRRAFLGTTAAGLGCAAAGMTARGAAGASGAGVSLPSARVHRIYVGRSGAAWPRPAFDPRQEVTKFEQVLAGLAGTLEGVELVGGELVGTDEEARRAAAAAGDADGILLIHLSLSVLGLMQRIVDVGKPTVVFSQPFSGHEWMFLQEWGRAGRPVVTMATSRLSDLGTAARLAAVPGRMRKSRVLVVGPPDGTVPARSAEQVRGKLGVEVVPVSVEQVVAAHSAVDPAAARAEARETWLKPARRIVEPSEDEIVKSAAMFLAMQRLMDEHRAQAITIRCLGGIPIERIGYPCLGFSRLLDLGLIGACEADMDSTLTMLLFRYAFGVPGFISDPLFDVSRNAVIHAHCTAPTRMDGPAGDRAPFDIRTHTDDDKGAALEIDLRVGQAITCAKLVNLDTMIASTGRIVEIPDFEDRGCRTQIVTEVADAQGMLDRWGCGAELDGWVAKLHRVVFYGDHMVGARHLCGLTGLKLVEGI